MNSFSIAVVGAGPRGLSILERIIAIHADQRPEWSLDVHLIDPGTPGQGAHSSDQPDYLLTNTVAGQISIFTDPSVRDAGPIKAGPSLLDWIRSSGYRFVGGRCIRTQVDGRDVHEDDYLPRSLLGEYLKYVYDCLCRSLPDNIRLTYHPHLAEDLERLPNNKLRIVLSGGKTVLADCAVITTGHSENRPGPEDDRLRRYVEYLRQKNPNLQYHSSVSPLSQLQSIAPGSNVAIQGMGLTAYDVIAELTVGRGGVFRTNALGRLAYHPSGREPHLILYSRQGIPFAARGVNQKGIAGLHRPVFFTRTCIDALRATNAAKYGNGKLDFDRDLWPILKKEMCYVFDATLCGKSPDPTGYVASALSQRAIDEVYAPLGEGRFLEQIQYDAAVRRYLECDLTRAASGNVEDPIKAATDVLRDTRDYVRYAVDYGGLTAESHRKFLTSTMPVMYRISAGAPKERNAEMLSLLDAGVVSFGPGPSPYLSLNHESACFNLRSTQFSEIAERCADVVIHARIECAIFPERQRQSFIRNMLDRGIVRPFKNESFVPGGIDVTGSQNVIDVAGEVQSNLWALGIITEGANWCSYVLPRVLVNSRFLQFSGRCVLQMFAFLNSLHNGVASRAVIAVPIISENEHAHRAGLSATPLGAVHLAS